MRVNWDELEDHLINGELLVTYLGKPFTGTAFELYANGQLLGEVNFQEGLRHGVSQGWYPTGQREFENHLEGDVGHGLSQSWYESGQLRSQELYEYGIKLQERVWDEQGNLVKDYSLPTSKYDSLIKLRLRHQSKSKGEE
jgi:antitoxin component YwqK of YwqJK toxin-antitoxin module